MRETVIQFGSGNFLRGFADHFLHILNETGLYDGKAVIVPSVSSETGNLINRQKGVYHLCLRGIVDGKTVSERTEIRSISRAINPNEDFEGFLALARKPDFRFVISNTTEAGIAYDAECKFEDAPPSSFPAKLARLLYERFQSGLNGFVMLPCELIERNGAALQKCVLQYAGLWGLGEGFIDWLLRENTFCNTLVDRIVTGYPPDAAELSRKIGYEDRLLDTAEPFHLWAIEGSYENELPLQKAGLNVIWTDDVSPYQNRKVRVLNGAHTAVAFPALLCGLETVADCLKDAEISRFLNACLFRHIVPALGEREEDTAFANVVLERFANPYLNHRLKAIALNSVSKYAVRVLPTAVECRRMDGVYPKPLALSLAALLTYYQIDSPQDSKAAIAAIRQNDLPGIVSNTGLWGVDLTEMQPLVEKGMDVIRRNGIREAIRWALL